MRPKNPYIRAMMHRAFEEGADDYEKLIKKDALYGEYGEDFIISSRVKPEDKNWAEPFFKTLEGKGHLVFIKEK